MLSRWGITLARHDRIDLIVNAAADTAFGGSLLDMGASHERSLAQLSMNAVVPCLVVAAAARLFFRDRPDDNRARRRHVINVGSVSGARTFPGHGQGVYAASKEALHALTGHLAHELDPLGVRANAIAPGRFPGALPTESVAELLARLDGGEGTGEIVTLDERGERRANLR